MGEFVRSLRLLGFLSRKDASMTRLYSLGAWSFTSVAIALAVLVPLTVPEDVWADSGSSCQNTCTEDCSYDCQGDQTCLQNCLSACFGQCCDDQCDGDSSCMNTCCFSACSGEPTCEQTCDTTQEICLQWTGDRASCVNNHRCGPFKRLKFYCGYNAPPFCICSSF